jgi:hypothetical protein
MRLAAGPKAGGHAEEFRRRGGGSARMTTAATDVLPPSTYAGFKLLTSTEELTPFLQQTLFTDPLTRGSTGEITHIRAKYRRVQAPVCAWKMYEVQTHAVGQERSLTVWLKAYFDGDALARYLRAVRPLLVASDPYGPEGCVRVRADLGVVVSVYPRDPVFPRLPACADAARVRDLLIRAAPSFLPARSPCDVTVSRVSYLPEISCLLKYSITGDAGSSTGIYGKIQHSRAGAFTYEVMQALWDVPARASGELLLAQPIAYLPDHDLLLQTELPGRVISGDRLAEEYTQGAVAAAVALSHVHHSRIAIGREHRLEDEIERIKRSYREFQLTAPRCYLLLRDLIHHIEVRAGKVPAEERVPSHGDFKYNQFVHQDGRFGVVDFEYFCQAEPSFDLGKFTSHIPPSFPPDWSDTLRAQEARRAFLTTYAERMPEYGWRRFPLYEATCLATRALVMMWSQPSGWRRAAESLLVMAFEHLNSRWDA